MKTILALLLLLATPLAAAPTILHISPPYAWTFGGNHVQILGKDLDSLTLCPALACGVSVEIGGKPATITAASSTFITVIAPPHAAGFADVHVSVAGRGEASLARGIEYTNVQAMTGIDYERRLLPVLASELPGAYGSIWSDRLVFRNASDFEFYVPAVYCAPNVSPCPALYAQPHTTTDVHVVPSSDRGPGAFIHIPKPLAEHVTTQFRIQDTSRQAQTWGTELPVVSVERDYRKTIRLLDIPNGAAFRAKLRIYGPHVYPAQVHLKIFVDNGPLVHEETVDLAGIVSAVVIDLPDFPSYAERDLLLGGGGKLRVEVTSEVPVWAFVAVTNNATQHVTTITPQGGQQ